MKKLLTVILAIALQIFNATILCGQDIDPQPAESELQDYQPSGTLPVLYINTADGIPVDQKVDYIDATAWFDAEGFPEYESLGSAEEPLALGIRGRGNSSWWSFDKKPYKLKFAKKTALMGNNPSKHFALLHLLGGMTSYFHEPLAFELARKVGFEWAPSIAPCEVVLNGEYIGLYFLSETVRVEPDRLNISTQPDFIDDEEMIHGGWLVEFDNYPGDNVLEYKEGNGREMRVTPHSPELLSPAQRDYIDSEFERIIESVYATEDYPGKWSDVIDGEAMARYYIVQEVMQNYDGFSGSFYIHKDSDTKWKAGPVWDFGYSLNEHRDRSFLKQFNTLDRIPLIRELLWYEDFRETVRQVWNPLYEEGFDWVGEVTDDWARKIETAGDMDREMWGFGHDNARWVGTVARDRVKSNAEWFNSFIYSDSFKDWPAPIASSGINAVLNTGTERIVYDLMGRRVTELRPGGLYISDGKKFIGR